MNFLVLFRVLFTIEPVFLEKTKIRICLVITLTVMVFEGVKAWFTLLGFQPRKISLTISFIVPNKVSVVFRFMGPIAFDAFNFLNPA